jgi:uncharacterized SAM-dependent methyltransferase
MFVPYNAHMIKKADLIKLLGGSPVNVAARLGYDGIRADNNITRLPDVLTKRQDAVIIMRMKAKRIAVPDKWQKK